MRSYSKRISRLSKKSKKSKSRLSKKIGGGNRSKSRLSKKQRGGLGFGKSKGGKKEKKRLTTKFYRIYKNKKKPHLTINQRRNLLEEIRQLKNKNASTHLQSLFTRLYGNRPTIGEPVGFRKNFYSTNIENAHKPRRNLSNLNKESLEKLAKNKDINPMAEKHIENIIRQRQITGSIIKSINV